ncbi:MAG: hypothetical protein JWL59_2611 [Chthoniobacteraceae bacterium]|nr:hypothetical protein [Chthoniobacteraceae bacterium]
MEVLVLETPGHSLDSVSWLLREQAHPSAVFTGDTLFVGDIGRINLRDGEEKPEVLAIALYKSLFDKLFTLPAAVRVLPAHGAGSLCGRSISADYSSRLETQTKTSRSAQSCG